MPDNNNEELKLPKYIYGEDNERFWLTFCTDITGKWNAGYSTPDGRWLDKPRVESMESIKLAWEELILLGDVL